MGLWGWVCLPLWLPCALHYLVPVPKRWRIRRAESLTWDGDCSALCLRQTQVFLSAISHRGAQGKAPRRSPCQDRLTAAQTAPSVTFLGASSPARSVPAITNYIFPKLMTISTGITGLFLLPAPSLRSDCFLSAAVQQAAAALLLAHDKSSTWHQNHPDGIRLLALRPALGRCVFVSRPPQSFVHITLLHFNIGELYLYNANVDDNDIWTVNSLFIRCACDFNLFGENESVFYFDAEKQITVIISLIL